MPTALGINVISKYEGSCKGSCEAQSELQWVEGKYCVSTFCLVAYMLKITNKVGVYVKAFSNIGVPIMLFLTLFMRVLVGLKWQPTHSDVI